MNKIYFAIFSKKDKSKIKVIDLSSEVDYERTEWSLVDDEIFYDAKSAIQHSKSIASSRGLTYSPFESRYGDDDEVNERVESSKMSEIDYASLIAFSDRIEQSCRGSNHCHISVSDEAAELIRSAVKNALLYEESIGNSYQFLLNQLK